MNKEEMAEKTKQNEHLVLRGMIFSVFYFIL